MKKGWKVLLFVVFTVIFLGFCSSYTSPQGQEVVTNETVKQLAKAGMSDAVIAQKITSSPVNFRLATADLLDLKKAGVSDYVIQVMQGYAIAQSYGARPNINYNSVPAASVSLPATSATTLTNAQSQYVVTNDEVIRILKSGQGESLVVKQITDCPVRFTFASQDMEQLRAAGVSAYLLQLMRNSQDLQAKIDAGLVTVPPTPCYPGTEALQSQERPQADSWRSQVLGKSTPENAVAALGQPDQDKTNQAAGLFLLEARFELKPVANDRVFRVLIFKKREGLNEARLVYLYGKLVLIDLYLKDEMDPNKLSMEYGVRFTPTEEVHDVKRQEIEDRYGVTRVDESGILGGALRRMRGYYYLYTLSNEQMPHAHVWAKAERMTGFRSLISTKQHLGVLPGWVKQVQLVSSELESTAMRGVLK